VEWYAFFIKKALLLNFKSFKHKNTTTMYIIIFHSSTAMFKDQKPYSLAAGFCSGGGRDGHNATPPGRKIKLLIHNDTTRNLSYYMSSID
jgi:hypothetical protein